MFRRALASAIVVIAAVAASGALGPWPASANPGGEPVDGINCDQAEGAVFHVHQHLAIFERGRSVPIPDDIGRPIVGNCLYWIHTHTTDGIVHVESPQFRTFTLGNVFDVWGEPLDARHAGPARAAKGAIRVYVDGRRYAGDPRKLELAQHLDIAIDAGPPYRIPPPFTAWGGQ